ncbi:MAG: hypothetical protein JWM31_1348, partial [Solirubrobacterales bacterium]|nr:hypothetical protein [Solirubrobacterales bacterium]
IIAATPQARALLRDARPLARRLPSVLDIANPALRSLPRLAESGDVQGLTAELRPMLATISRSAVPLGAFGEDIRPVAKCLNDNILPVLNGVVPDGSLTTNLKVYEELGDTFTGLGASTESFDANGPWVRYLIGLGNQALSTSDGGGTLSATADRPVAGSTPTPVSAPPLRPDVPCETQAVPSLESRMKPFQGTQTKAKVDKEQVTVVLDRGLATIKGLDAKGKDLAALQAQLATLLGPETAAEAKGTTATPTTAAAEPAADAKKAEDAKKAADAEKAAAAKKAATTTPAATAGTSR